LTASWAGIILPRETEKRYRRPWRPMRQMQEKTFMKLLAKKPPDDGFGNLKQQELRHPQPNNFPQYRRWEDLKILVFFCPR